MKREIFEISAEINGISNIIVGLSNQLDNSKTDTLSTESMQQAMFCISTYLDRIVEDLDDIDMLIEENKESEFQLTYQDGSYLYLLKGYGKQETGGYSIQIEDLSLWDNAIHLQTTLIGPEEDKDLKDEPSYPYLVVKMKYREEPVIFE